MAATIFDFLGYNLITAQLTRIEAKIDQLILGQQQGKELIMSEQDEIANLVEQIKESADIAESVRVGFQGMLEQQAKLNQQLQDAIAANASDVSPQIKAAADAVAQNNANLKASIPLMVQAVEEVASQ